MLRAIQIGRVVLTCCTTGQQHDLRVAAKSAGYEAFSRDYPHKENHAAYADYETPETLRAFVARTVNKESAQ